jgi:hypothetical protein
MDPKQHPANNLPPKSAPKHGKVDDYQAASRATAEDDYEDYSTHGGGYSAPKHTFRKVVLISFVLLVVLAAAGFAVYKLVLNKDDKKTNKQAAGTSQQSSTAASDNESLIASETEHYTSTGFIGLEFDYPKDWKVTEGTDGGVLTVKSPVLSLKQAGGQTSNGQVVFTVRNKQQALPEFDKGNAVAAIESEKINYTKPSSAQRAATYLSFLTYASSSQAGAIDGVYITGDVGYQKDQAIPKADFLPVDPVISVTFVKCSDSTCSDNGTATGIDASMWKDAKFGVPLKSMLQSLTIN